jgi:hypothetical protein
MCLRCWSICGEARTLPGQTRGILYDCLSNLPSMPKTEAKPHICPVCAGEGEQKIEKPYRDNKYCSKCISLYLDRARDSIAWSVEGAINRISDCESCKEIVKNTPMMKSCIACKGACVLWG